MHTSELYSTFGLQAPAQALLADVQAHLAAITAPDPEQIALDALRRCTAARDGLPADVDADLAQAEAAADDCEARAEMERHPAVAAAYRQAADLITDAARTIG
jgi:hypothetical protein